MDEALRRPASAHRDHRCRESNPRRSIEDNHTQQQREPGDPGRRWHSDEQARPSAEREWNFQRLTHMSFRHLKSRNCRSTTESGGSATKIRSGIDFPTPDALNIDTVLIVNGDGSDTFAIESISSKAGRIGSMELRNGNGNSTTTIESPLITLGNLVVSAETGFDNLTIHNAVVTGDVIGYFFDGGSDVRFDGATIGGLTDIFTTAETDYVRVIDSEFVGPLYVNTNEGDDIFTVTGACFNLIIRG